ncbi:hypothetical protein [Massilia sp. TS11]|uniref:hypothetical protein n=1 Tax=Massilia sp. TS11 TaxID=2908003 RepID=UPI001EDA3C32|nr:hypothetical protein [Massilia sp. TS11]MCG2585033.1 hypothetical protein [Massilia sp. TS11]
MLTIALLLLTPLLVWRVYARLKTLMQRQPSTTAKHLMGMVGFLGVDLLVGLSVPPSLDNLSTLAGGSALGLAYAWYALRSTRRESTPQGYFFTPNRRFGIAVPMLLFARLLYVGIDGYVAQQSNAAMLARITDHPLSLALIGLACGYFGGYSAGLFQWRRKAGADWNLDE